MKRIAVRSLAALWCAGLGLTAEPEIWSVAGDDGRARDFLLWPGGGAVLASAGRDADARGTRGFWHGSGHARLVMLESGASAEIRLRRDDASIAESPDERSMAAVVATPRPVTRIRGESAGWLGVWIWTKPDSEGSRYVTLLSDQTALATPGTHGRWLPVARGIRVEWHDGAIDLLQFDAAGPALRSWPRGTPTRTTRPEPTRPLRVGSDGLRVSP